MVKKCLVFFPCVTFGLAADVQIIVSAHEYKPVAFSAMPHRWTRPLVLTLGYVSLLTSILTYVICLVVFGGIDSAESLRRLVFWCFIIKAFTYSPFMGLEFYDTLFEQIYHDVQF